MKTKKYLFLLSLIIIGLSSCKDSDIMYYEGGSVLHFMKKTQGLSFMTKPNIEKDTMIVRALVVGNPVNYDRTFAVEVVDTSTTATPEQYRILQTIVPANDTCGYLHVEVTNPDFLNIKETTLTLGLIIKDNDAFKAGGWLSYISIVLTWTSDLIQPETWRAMRFFFTSKYSSNVYRAIIASTGLTEFWYYNPDPETGYQLDQYEGWVYGKKFGDWIREYNETHDDVYRHDDGDYEGEEIVPIY